MSQVGDQQGIDAVDCRQDARMVGSDPSGSYECDLHFPPLRSN
jgi:hypothetical protein